MSDPRAWTTHDERVYLESIGQRHEATRSIISRREMLERYIAAAEQRERWGAIDRDEILAFARSLYNRTRAHHTAPRGNQPYRTPLEQEIG